MAELVEIDENLIRNELHYIDRGDQLKRRKEIYESLYPETKHNANFKGNQYISSDAESALEQKETFAEDTAKKTGQSARKVYEEIQISNNIIDNIKDDIKKLDLPKVETLRISRLEPQEQTQVIEKLKNKESKKVGQAINQIKQENKIFILYSNMQ